MTNQDIIDLSMSISESLYFFTSFVAGLYVGYLFGKLHGDD